jgi:hypothetical protein
MNTPCPCGCSRRLPLSQPQIIDVAVHARWKYELDVAQDYNVSVDVVRHVRHIMGSDGRLQRPA